jgi:hypothetical protein
MIGCNIKAFILSLLLAPLVTCLNFNDTFRGHTSNAHVFNDAAARPLQRRIFKVAVIGAGVGGAFATFNLRKELGDDVQLDVFDSTSRVGGRAKSFLYGGKVT